MENLCVCCGASIPEGSMVCYACSQKQTNNESELVKAGSELHIMLSLIQEKYRFSNAEMDILLNRVRDRRNIIRR